MTSPFRCGPNPCAWPCKPKVECLVASTIFSTNDWDRWNVVGGVFSQNAQGVTITSQTNATAHETIEPAEAEQYFQVKIKDISGAPGGAIRIFLNANDTHTSYMFLEWEFGGPVGSEVLRIGTNSGVAASVQGPSDLTGEWILYLCYDTARQLVGGIGRPGDTTPDYTVRATNVSDTGFRRAGIGSGTQSTTVTFEDARLEKHGTILQGCPTCYYPTDCLACILDTTPTEMLLEFEGTIANLNCQVCSDTYTDINVITTNVSTDICAYWAFGPLPTIRCPIQTYPSIDMFYTFQINSEAPPIDTRTLEATIFQRFLFSGSPASAAIARFYHRTPFSSSETFDCYEYLKNGIELLPDDRAFFPAPFYCDWINSPGLKCTATALGK